ncbi:amidase [Ectothiorhodospiraceae bacterium WFHF3C12]|nr:amidase [Ectothiorhodospiraceae bacterium WFHF3C12]
MSQATDPAELTALELATLYREGELSPVEATRACLERINRYNDSVNAYCFLDEETTLEAARRSEERFNRLTPLGPLDGIPLGIKDMFATRDWPNRKGSAIIPDTPGETDAPVIAALRRQGFVPTGRTTTPEFGWKGVTDSPLFGVTSNPFDPTRTAGGSSGGSAAAVPLGMSPLALGTDAGGSIRIPAGFSGLVGHKPTLGRVPMWPASAFAPLAHPGPMTWTVEDAALLMNVMCEPDVRDTTLAANDMDFLEALEGGINGWRVAYSPDLGFVHVDPEIAASVRRAVRVLEDLGARVEEIDPGFEDPRAAFDILFFGGAANALRDVTPEQRAQMDPSLIEAAEARESLSMLDYLGAMNQRAALIERMELFHRRFDLLVTPTLPIPAFTAGLEVPDGWHDPRWPSWTPFTYPFNMTGQPGCSVPCGFTEAGLPIGVQFVGARHADAAVLRAAHAYQSAAPLTDRRPTL